MTTYAILKTDAANWLIKNNLTSVIPSFIRLAEARIRSDVRVPAMQQKIDLTVSSQSVSLPANFLEPIRLYLNVNNQRDLTYRTPSTFSASYEAQDSGAPSIWTIEGQNILFAPVPADSPTVKMLYYAAFDTLSADADTNWLLTYFYNVYLYATLAEGFAYLQDDEQAAKWGQQYATVVENLKKRFKWNLTTAPLIQFSRYST